MENPVQKAFQEPFILLPIVVAVVVILTVVFSRGEKGKPVKAQEVPVSSSSPVEPAASTSGKRKKKNRSKKKSAKSESEREAESSEETSDEAKPATPVAAAPAETKKKTAAAAVAKKPEPVAEVEDEGSSSSDDEELLLPKIVSKKTAVVAAAAPTVAKKAAVTATAEQKKVAAEVAPVPTVVSTHYDGWAVVEDKRFKAKIAKKAEAAAAAEAAALAAAMAAAASAAEAAALAAAAAEAQAAAKEESDDEPDVPVIETITKEIKVDAKKLGLLIGPKGATKIAIQNATATSIQMPKTPKEETTGPVTINISGPELGVEKASQALHELIAKGYCSLLAPDDFQESYVAVHPKYLKDIIGRGGSVIKALSAHTNVKITVPDNIKPPGPDGKVTKVKVGLTGQKEKVSLCRSLIKDLTKYYHTTVTHPGMVHAELDIPANYYNVIIGAKGSEIKNIQNSHKVSVYIPDADSANPNVVVVGETENVLAAKNHIEKLMVRADERAAAAAAAAAENAAVPTKPTSQQVAAQPATIGEHVIGATVGGGPAWNTNTAVVRKPKAEEAEEEWVKEFAPNSSLSINITSILGENSKFAPVSVQPAVVPAPVSIPAPIEKIPAPSSAWNNISSAWNN